MLRTRRVENLRHGALTTTAGTREGSTITATASPHPGSLLYSKIDTFRSLIICKPK